MRVYVLPLCVYETMTRFWLDKSQGLDQSDHSSLLSTSHHPLAVALPTRPPWSQIAHLSPGGEQKHGRESQFCNTINEHTLGKHDAVG